MRKPIMGWDLGRRDGDVCVAIFGYVEDGVTHIESQYIGRPPVALMAWYIRTLMEGYDG